MADADNFSEGFDFTAAQGLQSGDNLENMLKRSELVANDAGDNRMYDNVTIGVIDNPKAAGGKMLQVKDGSITAAKLAAGACSGNLADMVSMWTKLSLSGGGITVSIVNQAGTGQATPGDITTAYDDDESTSMAEIDTGSGGSPRKEHFWIYDLLTKKVGWIYVLCDFRKSAGAANGRASIQHSWDDIDFVNNGTTKASTTSADEDDGLLETVNNTSEEKLVMMTPFVGQFVSIRWHQARFAPRIINIYAEDFTL